MLHIVCSWQYLMGDYVSQTRDQYLVVLPQMNVNFPNFYFSFEMNFKCVDFERVVAQLKDVVIFHALHTGLTCMDRYVELLSWLIVIVIYLSVGRVEWTISCSPLCRFDHGWVGVMTLKLVQDNPLFTKISIYGCA